MSSSLTAASDPMDTDIVADSGTGGGDDEPLKRDFNNEERPSSPSADSDIAMADAASAEPKPAAARVVVKPRMSLPLSKTLAAGSNQGTNAMRPPSAAKPRIRLSLKLPTKANARAKAGMSQELSASEDDDDDEEETSEEDDDDDSVAVKATVVLEDEDDDDDETASNVHVTAAASAAVVAPAPKMKKKKKPSSGTSSTATGATNSKLAAQRRMLPHRPTKIPPLHSPGLLLAPSSSAAQYNSTGPNSSNTAGSTKQLNTPAQVFDHTMAAAGYTLERRTKRPHRGSSIQRTVGDMFDSNVKLALHFPPHVPPEMFEDAERVRKVMRQLDRRTTAKDDKNSTDNGSNKRPCRRPWGFRDMIPPSLIIDYPPEYTQKRLEYIEQVHKREQAILVWQEVITELDTETGSGDSNSSPIATGIPPIPRPPSPPPLSECQGWQHDGLLSSSTAAATANNNKYNTDDPGPIYIPKGKEELVSHLDTNCFHLTQGRYFHLTSNLIADPNFYGPNAPGITGVQVGAGLATAGTSSSGLTLTSSSFSKAAATAASASMSATATTSTRQSKTHDTAVNGSAATASTVSSSARQTIDTGTTATSLDTQPSPTATSLDLRKLMETPGTAESLRQTIIRSAVHAARSGQYGGSFTFQSQTYPDVSKAFRDYANIKPCQRCKQNKQGSYHCRVRRRHPEVDYDGGNSSHILSTLFVAPLETLLSGNGVGSGTSAVTVASNDSSSLSHNNVTEPIKLNGQARSESGKDTDLGSPQPHQLPLHATTSQSGNGAEK